jgi:cytidylate kinase
VAGWQRERDDFEPAGRCWIFNWKGKYMNIGNQADKCLSFIKCDLKPQAKRWLPHTKFSPTITLSRQTGCEIMAIAGELAGMMQDLTPDDSCPWTIFDKNLVERVLEEHKLPRATAKYMPEDRVSAIQDAVEELLGLHPSSRTLVQQTAETIHHVAALGHVILIGRAANIITRNLQNVFHVRLVAPLEVRVERIMAREHLDPKAARELIHKGDLARKRYLKDHFHADIDDALQYDLVLNTARLPHRVVAHTIKETVVHWAKAQ